MTLIFDCETNGLLAETTKIHSLVIYDTETADLISCTNHKGYTSIEEGLKLLQEAEEISGHNIIKFDLPVLQKIYPWFSPKGKIYDTLVVAKLAYPDIGEKDAVKIRRKQFPKSLWGKYSLKAFGYRLGILKGTYGEQDNAWAEWSEQMQSYCEQDVMVTKALYQTLTKKDIPSGAIELENRFAHIISLQEQRGVKFNKDKAIELASQLKSKQYELETELRKVFPDKVIEKEFIPKVNNKTKGYIKGQPFIKRTIVPFKPSSRQQVAERLKDLYNWQPTEFTEKGQPKIDDEVLKALPYKEAPLLAEYFLVTKILGYITEGKNAWLKCERDGIVYGQVNTIGAVTRRCTHNNPNLAQTPSPHSPYGKECRSLFEAREGFDIVGCDAKALELRCLAHYMKDKDYTNEILNGDIHTKNQKAAELPTRDNAKTFIYGFLYGAGDAKVGSIIGKNAAVGKKIKAKFLKNLPSLGSLIKRVQNTIKKRGFLYSLDRSTLNIRAAYKGLNTLLQSAGAIAMKRALVILFDWCCERGWIKDRWYLNDGSEDKIYFILNVHDEYQAEVKEEVKEEYKKLAVKAIQEAGKFYNFNCPLDGDVKEGKNWYDTH